MTKSDKRVKKTKQALHIALAKLLSEKSLHEITIKELTETADVHRATFYSHYQGIYDLYKDFEADILLKLAELVAGKLLVGEDRHSKIVHFIYNNKEIARMFFSKNGYKDFQIKVIEILEQKYLELWMKEENLTDATEELKYINTYQINGMIAIIGRWIDTGFAHPKEDIIDLIRRADLNIDYI